MKMPQDLYKEWMEARPKKKKPTKGFLGSKSEGYEEAQKALEDHDNKKENE